MGKIIYIRHGQASVFSDNYDQLSAMGEQQAIELGKYLKKEGVHIDNLYTGPLKRHHQTTHGLLKGLGQKISPLEMEGLREHQGFSALKKLMPSLVQSDEQIKELANLPWEGKADRIKHHMRVFENFSMRWAHGEFDAMISGEFQSWSEFEGAASMAYREIHQETLSGMTSVVVTSGGPKSVACGKALGLSLDKIVRTSWVIYNCSVTEFLSNGDRLTLSTFNNVSYFADKSFRTLV